MDVFTERIIWVHGPCAGASSEDELVRLSGLGQLLPQNKRILADGGFKGLNFILVPHRRQELVGPDSAAKAALNRDIARRRWKIEAVFSRMKNFMVLTSTYRKPPVGVFSRSRFVQS